MDPTAPTLTTPMLRSTATALGAVVGGFVAAAFTAVFGSATALESVDAVVLSGGRARPTFLVSTGAMWLLVLGLGILGGVIVSAVVVGLVKQREPDAATFPTRWILIVGAITGATVAYVGVRSGIGAGGTITQGTISLSVFRAMITFGLTGVVTGAVVGWSSHALARPSFLGLEGVAWPTSRSAFMSESVRVLAAPIASGVFLLIFAVILSQILLTSQHEFEYGAVIVGTIVAAGILGGASLVAARPWDRRSTDDTAP